MIFRGSIEVNEHHLSLVRIKLSGHAVALDFAESAKRISDPDTEFDYSGINRLTFL
ncbi:hypothetical protein D3C73_1563910 [compost metagenome]